MCVIAQYLAPWMKCDLHRVRGAPAGYQKPEWSCRCRVCRARSLGTMLEASLCECHVCKWRAKGEMRTIPTTYVKAQVATTPCCTGFVAPTNVFFATVDDGWFDAWLDEDTTAEAEAPSAEAEAPSAEAEAPSAECECTFTTIKGCPHLHYIGSVWCECGISCQCECNCCVEHEQQRCEHNL